MELQSPNIVYLFCDELRTDALGCYGNPYTELETPHIDSIARNGVRFSDCYCNSPVCVPSRMSLLTGLYPEDTGVYNNEAAWKKFKLHTRFQTLPKVFEEQGYATANFGKIHLPPGLQPFGHHNPEGSSMDMGLGPDEDVQLITPTGMKTKIGGRFPAGMPYPPDRVAQNALEWMKTAQEPFFMRISFLQPHTPVFPKPPFDMMYYGQPFPRSITRHSRCEPV